MSKNIFIYSNFVTYRLQRGSNKSLNKHTNVLLRQKLLLE